jgi:peptidyl-prolyl cis-trans isomerase SurA
MLLLLLLVAWPARGEAPLAPTGDRAIVAVVNEDIITRRDLEQRIDLVIATGNLERQPGVRQAIAPEVLRLLVDDRLKQQEARRLSITVSQREVERALVDISRQLNVEPSGIPDYLAARGASMATLISQLETEIGWIKTVTRAAGERQAVSEEEIEQEVVRLRGATGGTEYRIAEVFLPVEEGAGERPAMELADRIVRESRAGGSFAALARTFSQSASAEQGGDLGWIRPGQIDPRIEEAVQRLDPGQVSNPIRTEGGIYVVELLNRRAVPAGGGGTTILTLHQVVLPLSAQASGAAVAEQLAKAADLRAGEKTCAQFSERGRLLGAVSAGDLGRVDLDKLPPPIRQIVGPLAAGQVSEPIRSPDGVVLLMVCDRQEEEISPDIRQQVERRLFEQRMSATSRQLLRDLRRTALLDVRM